jgi:hypothetical protein
MMPLLQSIQFWSKPSRKYSIISTNKADRLSAIGFIGAPPIQDIVGMTYRM